MEDREKLEGKICKTWGRLDMGREACKKQMKFKIQSFLTEVHPNKYTQTKAKFNFSVE